LASAISASIPKHILPSIIRKKIVKKHHFFYTSETVTRPQGWGGVGRRLWWWEEVAVVGNGEGEVVARVWERERGAKSLRAEG
jgi:hypothetical protein